MPAWYEKPENPARLAGGDESDWLVKADAAQQHRDSLQSRLDEAIASTRRAV